MRQAILMISTLVASFTLTTGSGSALGQSVSSIDVALQQPGVTASDSLLAVIEGYLAGRHRWFHVVPSVRICWPLRDSLKPDPAAIQRLIGSGIATDIDPGCGRVRPSPDPRLRLVIFEVKFDGDTARVVASGPILDVCSALQELGALTRALVIGRDGELWRASGPWTLREIRISNPAGGDCVTITPSEGDL